MDGSPKYFTNVKRALVVSQMAPPINPPNTCAIWGFAATDYSTFDNGKFPVPEETDIRNVIENLTQNLTWIRDMVNCINKNRTAGDA